MYETFTRWSMMDLPTAHSQFDDEMHTMDVSINRVPPTIKELVKLEEH
jgi:hypothetical protein